MSKIFKIRRDVKSVIEATPIPLSELQHAYDTDDLYLGTNGGNKKLTGQDLVYDVRKQGAIGDGVTDDTAAVQAAFDLALQNGGAIYFPHGTYRITTPIGVESELIEGKSLPAFLGESIMSVTNNLPAKEQKGSIILADGVGMDCIKIINTGTGLNFYYGAMFSNITLLKKDGDQSLDGSIGLNLQGCLEPRFYNFATIGFDIGAKYYDCFSWDAFGFTAVRNNIGVLLDRNSNAVGFFGSQLHQNKINVKIVGGVNISFNKTTLEGSNSIPVVIISGEQTPSDIKFSNCYLEANISGFKIGKNENDSTSINKIYNVSFDNCNFETAGVVPFELDNVADVNIDNISWGQTTPLIETTSNTGNVSVNGYSRQFQSDIGDRYSVDRRIGYKNRVNLLPNGFLTNPDLTDFKRGGLTAEYDEVTIAGEKLIKITVPTGTVNNFSQRIPVKLDKRVVGKRLIFSGVGFKDSGMTADIRGYTPAFSGITGASVALPDSIGKVGFYFDCPDEDYINISILLNNTSGSTKYCYIKTMVLVEDGVGQVQQNPIDFVNGYSGTVAATTLGVTVPLAGWDIDMYEVIATPKGNVTVYVTKANDQFTLTTVGGDASVAYLVIPKAGIAI